MKKHLLIGNKNAGSFGDFFPYFKAGEEKIGKTIPGDFEVPGGGITTKLRGLCRWFGNLENMTGKKLDLELEYTPGFYLEYDNYKGIINVDKIKFIPKDYTGPMGVPLTILEYDLEGYEILGIADRQNTYGMRTRKYGPEDMDNYNDMNPNAVVILNGEYKSKYSRVIIRKI